MKRFFVLVAVTAVLGLTAFAKNPQPTPNSSPALTVAEATPPPAPIAQAVPAQAAPPQAVEAQSSDFPLMRTLGGLGLVLCLIVFGFLAAKKFAPQFFTKNPSGKNLKLLETLSMGEKRSIAVVEFHDQRFLVGNTPQQISLLACFPGTIPLVSEPEISLLSDSGGAKAKATQQFRNIYEMEKTRPRNLGKPKQIPEDVKAKMRQLREALER
jgi:flagellar biosynthetic protein FliO